MNGRRAERPSPHRRFAGFLVALCAVSCTSPTEEGARVGAGGAETAIATPGRGATWPAALGPEAEAALPRLRELMREGLRRRIPFQISWPETSETGEPLKTIFHGSYDRHSNMAAHWAVLVCARLAGDDATVAEIVERFDAATLATERRFIAGMHAISPVRPYDQTWLVLFLSELERHVADDARFEARRLRAEIEARLLDYADEQEFPPRPEPPSPTSRAATGTSSAPTSRGASRATARPQRAPRAPREGWTSGAYPSAVWALLVLELAGTVEPESAERLARVRRRKLPVVAARLRSEPPENRYRGAQGFDFFHAPTLATLAERVVALRDAGYVAEDPPYVVPEAEPLPEKILLLNCHRIGAELTKAWAAAFDAGRGDAAARAVAAARIAAVLARRDAWDGDYLTTSHWVPQFVVFPLWLAAGRP